MRVVNPSRLCVKEDNFFNLGVNLFSIAILENWFRSVRPDNS